MKESGLEMVEEESHVSEQESPATELGTSQVESALYRSDLEKLAVGTGRTSGGRNRSNLIVPEAEDFHDGVHNISKHFVPETEGIDIEHVGRNESCLKFPETEDFLGEEFLQDALNNEFKKEDNNDLEDLSQVRSIEFEAKKKFYKNVLTIQ